MITLNLQLFGAHFKGLVKNKENGKTISHALVYIEKVNLYAYTNKHGNFEFDLPIGTHKIIIIAYNFYSYQENILIHIGNNLLNFDLKPLLLNTENNNITPQKLNSLIFKFSDKLLNLQEE
ncbi:MAG: carboxypeptidase-like regulatory domain-containing protein, partial [Sediminibacterium sp.]|nr:carboxypeptidase-like regulatory domain-containing protein [Sediminibacterium sp.]